MEQGGGKITRGKERRGLRDERREEKKKTRENIGRIEKEGNTVEKKQQ
jgi:hypothetical protein